MAKEYSELEKHVLNQFSTQAEFQYEEITYHVVSLDDVDKPRPGFSGGECKTDVFVLAFDNEGGERDFKISIKREGSNEFQQNKMTPKIAQTYFGNQWKTIIKDAALAIEQELRESCLICPTGKYPTKPNSILLGWKIEIASKPRKLSVELNLTDQEKRDYVYKGINQPEEKRNSLINGKVVTDSGIAQYLLKTEIEKIESAQDVVDQMESIDEIEPGEMYLIFTANNYRTDCDKADGSRCLAVSIEWNCVNQKLVPTFHFDTPLEKTGEGDMKPYLIEALREIGFEIPCELPKDFEEKYLADYQNVKIS